MIIDAYDYRPAKIAQIVREAPRAVSIRVQTEDNYGFEVGQHAVVRVTMPDGTKLVRQYSFSRTSRANDIWFTIVEEQNGAVSGWFCRTAHIGDTVEISQPFTGPLMQKNPRGEICMIAGGSGIAPLMAWTEQLRKTSQPFTLLYSTRTDEQCFNAELRPSSKETIVVRLTDAADRFSPAEITGHLSPEATVLICGSRPFVLAMRQLCETIVPAEHIYSEAFTL